MSEFELITITFSFVLGLGVAQILTAASAAFRNQRERPLHWMPLGFAASIFLFHIQYWFVLFDYDANLVNEWTWSTYGTFMALAVVLFLSGGVVLPTPGTEAGISLAEDFDERGKLSLLFLAVYILGWVPVLAWARGGGLIDAPLYLVLATLLLVTYYTRNRTLRNAASVAFFAVQGISLLFVWASPADLG